MRWMTMTERWSLERQLVIPSALEAHHQLRSTSGARIASSFPLGCCWLAPRVFGSFSGQLLAAGNHAASDVLPVTAHESCTGLSVRRLLHGGGRQASRALRGDNAVRVEWRMRRKARVASSRGDCG